MTETPEPPEPAALAKDEAPGLRSLAFKPGYDSSDQVLETFYVPALTRACSYDRSVGYFRSSALSVAARGMSRFINRGGTVRLLCGAEISTADRDALLGRAKLDGAFAERLADRLVTESEVDRRRLEVLAWLAREGRLEVRIAIAVDDQGAPLVGGDRSPTSTRRSACFETPTGMAIAFQGSVNESATAWTINFESFSVYASWDATAGAFHLLGEPVRAALGRRGPRASASTPCPRQPRQRAARHAPDIMPGERDPEEPPSPAMTRLPSPVSYGSRRACRGRGRSRRGDQWGQVVPAPAAERRAARRHVSAIVARRRRGRARQDHLRRAEPSARLC